jgi:adenine specific DNA methylase Mod
VDVTAPGQLRIHDFVGLDPDDNLLIQGEAQAVLAALQTHPRYSRMLAGGVKLAYLDPPFNTGRNFGHYLDRDTPSRWNTKLKDLLMMVRNLLVADGSVWLHLDDSEQHRARLVLDEVFGNDNFAATVIWERTKMPRLGSKAFAIRHDYIHVYRKSSAFRLARPENRPVEAIWTSADTGSNEDATAESATLFDSPFATPKPEKLLRRIIELTTEPGDLVLDCFSGSGTTAAVAHKLGRRWLGIEAEAATVENFFKPRMRQVVEGTDRGGVSNEIGWIGGGGFTELVLEQQLDC